MCVSKTIRVREFGILIRIRWSTEPCYFPSNGSPVYYCLLLQIHSLFLPSNFSRIRTCCWSKHHGQSSERIYVAYQEGYRLSSMSLGVLRFRQWNNLDKIIVQSKNLVSFSIEKPAVECDRKCGRSIFPSSEPRESLHKKFGYKGKRPLSFLYPHCSHDLFLIIFTWHHTE